MTNRKIPFGLSKLQNQSSKDNGTDDYYNIFPKTAIFFTGRFLKCNNSANKWTINKLVKDRTIIEDKKGLIFTDDDYADILVYVKQSGLIHVYRS